MNADFLTRRIAKPLVFLLCLLPALWLAAAIIALQNGGIAGWQPTSLGANPVEKIQDTLGIWGLRLLLVTLAVTPLRTIGRWPRLISFRRMLGLSRARPVCGNCRRAPRLVPVASMAPPRRCRT